MIEELAKIYPEQEPKPTESLAKIMYEAGQRSVVVGLERRLKEQEKDILSSEIIGSGK